MAENVIFSFIKKNPQPVSYSPYEQSPPFYSNTSTGSKGGRQKHSTKPLLETSAVFPFDLIPDKIQVDKNKVRVIHKPFFFSDNIHTILIRSIKDISVQTDVFFATIKIIPDGYPVGEAVTIKYLKKNDALKICNLVQGLMICYHSGIDPSEIIEQHLAEKVYPINQFLLTQN